MSKLIGSSGLGKISLGLLFGIGMAGAAFAQGATVPADVADGQQIWSQKAGCPFCHGWAGDGQGDPHSDGNAPSLRTTQLTPDQIREVIQCGRPGTAMPHFDKFAYTDKRCYGSTADDLGKDVPNQPPTPLQKNEIQAVADYVAYKLKGAGPVTQEECTAYFNGPSETCSALPKGKGAALDTKAKTASESTRNGPNG